MKLTIATAVLLILVVTPFASAQVASAPADAPMSNRKPGPYVEPPPPPESGANSIYEFRVSRDYPGMYEVLPRGESEPTLVSRDFLALALNTQGITEEQRLEVLAQYPDMVLSQHETVMNENYPATDTQFTDNFEDLSVTGTGPEQGGATVTQDPMLRAYVRVRIKGEDGTEQEFSLSRHAMAMILANPTLRQSPNDLLAALRQYPFRLPEEARARYDGLPRSELFAMAARTPLLARQDFIRSYDAFKKDAERASRTNLVRQIPWKQAVSERARESVGLGPLQQPAGTNARGGRAAVRATPRTTAPAMPAPAAEAKGSRIPYRALYVTAAVFLVIGIASGFVGGRLRGRGSK